MSRLESGMDIRNNEHEEITEDMVLNGSDMQGLDWSSLGCERDTFKKYRTERFTNYQSIDMPAHVMTEEPKNVIQEKSFYTFKQGNIGEECSIGHFQLRKLLWATSKNDVYFLKDDTIRHWSPQRAKSKEVASFPMKIISMTCAHGILLVGGSRGEYAYRRLDAIDSMSYCGAPTQDPYGTTNHLDIVDLNRGGLTAAISGNDQTTYLVNLGTMVIEQYIKFKFPVNNTAVSPNKKLICAVGDSTRTSIADINTGREIISINDHSDFSFSCCWSPDGMTLATGNQDKTTRVYDIRNTSRVLHLLGAEIGTIRSLQYSSDGKYLVAAEPIDYVHVYDVKSGYRSNQIINLFGSIAGVSLTSDSQALFIANSNDDIGQGIYEFHQTKDAIPFIM
ncbi:hypothetical protein BDF14DRAFT_1776318 [Spinellus fusiger]|nr:hypothetical protein BDF14DRAFT_1776318 [Spinellus fusiger]